MRNAAWRDHDPSHYEASVRTSKARGQTANHRAKAQRIVFNRDVGATIAGWTEWNIIDLNYVGGSLLGMACDVSGGHFARHVAAIGQAPAMLVCSPAMMAKLEKDMDRAADLCPLRLPTIIPPRPWATTPSSASHASLGRLSTRAMGGYWTTAVRPIRLINGARGATSGVDYSPLHAPLNALQSVAWRINQDVHRIAKALHDANLQDGTLAGQMSLIGPLSDDATDIAKLAKRKHNAAAHDHNRKHHDRILKPARLLDIVTAHL